MSKSLRGTLCIPTEITLRNVFFFFKIARKIYICDDDTGPRRRVNFLENFEKLRRNRL